MLTMNNVILAEKNKLSQTGVWPWLLALTPAGTNTTSCYTNNTEAITYGGNLYSPMPFRLDPIERSADGTLQILQIVVTDIGLTLQQAIRDNDGLRGASASLTQVNTNLLNQDFSGDTVTFQVNYCQNHYTDIILYCGIPGALKQRVPEDQFLPLQCRHDFRIPSGEYGSRCGYTGKSIVSITLPHGSPVQVRVTAHGFLEGQNVRVYGAGGLTPSLNGDYTINLYAPEPANVFVLAGTDGASFSGSYSGGGKAGYALCTRLLTFCRSLGRSPNYGGTAAAPRIQSGSPYNQLLGEFLGKPFESGATGPAAYDCYGLCRAFWSRLGASLPDLGQTSVERAEDLYRDAQPEFIKLTWPRPWSLVSLRREAEVATHCGIVLPTDGLFLHAQEKSGVVAQPLAHRYWHPRIEGYYWPKGIVEVVLMHSPAGLDHSWAFFREGLTLAEMMNVPDDEQAQIRVFMDGREVQRGAWAATVPTALNQIVVRPLFGNGQQAGMAIAMVALMVVASWAVPALGAEMGAGTAFAVGTVPYAMAMAGVMIGGSYLLNALIAPDKPNSSDAGSSYSWSPETVQRSGEPIPRLYGQVPVYGNIIMGFADVSNTMATYSYYESIAYPGYDGEIYYSSVDVHSPYLAASDYTWNIKLAHGDGPIQGVIPGTETINGQPASAYTGIHFEHKPGTDIQAATTLGDRVQYEPQLKVEYGTPQSYVFPDTDVDRLAVILGFPQGLIQYDGSGNSRYSCVRVQIEIRPAGGAWHTLASAVIQAQTTKWIHGIYLTDGTYDGGSPLALTRGTQYEVRVTRLTPPGDTTVRDDTYFEAIEGIYDDGFRYPGLAYTAISALASEQLNTSLQFQAVAQGRILQVYNGSTWSLQYSDNPAWVLLDLYTRPVLKGDGGGTPYSIEYYRGVDRSWIDTDAFYALAQWCDTLVPDGKGGPEKQFVFNGTLDTEDQAWNVALKVAAMCRAWPFFNGRQITVAIDKAATPVQAFTVGNILKGDFDETWLDADQRVTEIDYTILDQSQNYARTPVCVADQQAGYRMPLSVDGWGITSQSQVYRTGIHALTVNRLMPRSVEFPADLDALYCKIGDVIYVQHNNMAVNQGGRVVAVNGNKITVDFDPPFDSPPYSVLVRTASTANGEYPTLYGVAGVGGRDITIALPDWVYVPQIGDVVMYGQTTQINDLYRIRTMQRSQDGQVRIFATAYDEDYYGPDALAPIIATQQAVTAAQSNRLAHTEPPSWSQLNSAFPPAQITGNAVEAQPRLSCLTFAGNGVDTVTWVGSDRGGCGCMLYQGTSHPIAPNSIGTTKRYIYFDPTAQNPTVLYATDNRADLLGLEQYVYCVNDHGVAYPQPGIRLGLNASLIGVEEGADVTADHQADINGDEITQGSLGIKTFHDYFEDPNNNVVARWLNHGTTNLTILPGGLTGGKFLRVGDNAGNDEAWLIYYKSIPFDPAFLYQVQCRVRRTAGIGTVYLGVAGRDSTDTAWVAIDGANTPYNQHYICASAASPGSDWTVYTGYFKGTGVAGNGTAKADPAAPGVLHQNVRWIRPIIIVNFTGQAGVTDIDDITIDIVPAQVQNTSNVNITGGTITGITDLAVADGGTGTSTGSITGPGALTFAAGGSNQNVTLTPSGSGYSLLNGNVGLGTTAPTAKLHILDTVGTPTNGDSLILHAGSIISGGGTIGFYNYYGGSYPAATWRLGAVGGVWDAGATGYGGSLVFYTNNDSGLTAVTEKMRIKPSGKVGIGVVAPNELLEVGGKIRANTSFNLNGTDGVSDSGAGVPTVLTLSGGIVTAVTKSDYLNQSVKTTASPTFAGLTLTNALALGQGGTGATDAAGGRTALGLVIGTNVQAYDAELAALAGLTSAADKVPYFTGSGSASLADLTSFGRSLIDDADAGTARTTLGLGGMATQAANSVAISGGSITGITDLAVADGGTGTSTGSITGPGALTFAAGGSNQNVTLTPSGTGYSVLNGNVGIGTASPQNKLVVSNAGAQGVEIAPTGGIGSGVFIQGYDRVAGAYTDLTFYGANFHFYKGTAPAGEVLTISGSNVGIGTTGPGCPLDLQVDAAKLANFQRVTTATASAYLMVQNAKRLLLGVDNSAGNNLLASGSDAYATVLAALDNYPLVLATYNAERMRITPGGDVGIGTASPNQTGWTKAVTAYSASSTAGFEAASGRTNVGGTIGGFNMVLSANSTNKEGGGMYGLVYGSTAGNQGMSLVLYTKDDNAVTTEKLRILGNGNVGIGTTAPTARLHILDTGALRLLLTALSSTPGRSCRAELQ